jgi:1-acyl-sn-glycerol-3-phosphate acyltransferase
VFSVTEALYQPFGFILRHSKTKRTNICHKLATTWARSVLFFSPWWKFKISGRENLPLLNNSAVLIANHESMTDIIVIYALGTQFRWIAKKSLFNIPFLGLGMKLAGYIPLERQSTASQKNAIKQAHFVLENGTPLLFFPEGTRSHDGRIGEFKKGAYDLAIKTKTQIIPIILNGTGNLLTKGSVIPQPATAKIKILPPISAQDGESVENFRDRVRSLVVKEHELISS